MYDLESTATQLVITGATRVVNHRGDTLNAPTLTVTLDSPAEDVVRVRVEHHRGARPPQRFDLDETAKGTAEIDGDHGVLRSGTLEARVTRAPPGTSRSPRTGRS